MEQYKAIVGAAVTCVILAVAFPVIGQPVPRDTALSIAEALRHHGVLSPAGAEALTRRIRWTDTATNHTCCAPESGLWRSLRTHESRDTVYEISRATILMFLQGCFMGEAWYRSGESEKRKLMKNLGLSSRYGPEFKGDTVAFLESLRKVDSLDRFRSAGQLLEASIPAEDRETPVLWFELASPDAAASFEALPRGYIAASMSVTGKLRSRMVQSLKDAGLIDNRTAATLHQKVASDLLSSELNVVHAAYLSSLGQDGQKPARRKP